MNIENLIDEIEDVADTSWHLPMSGGKAIVDTSEIKRLIEEIKLQLPKEIVQARKIIEERTNILESAQKEAENMIKISEDKIREMISKSEIVKNAQSSANKIITDAKTHSNEMKKSAQEYADNIMKQLDEIVSNNLIEIRKARKILHYTEE